MRQHPQTRKWRIVHCDLRVKFCVDAGGERQRNISILDLHPEVFTDDLARVDQLTGHRAAFMIGYEPW